MRTIARLFVLTMLAGILAGCGSPAAVTSSQPGTTADATQTSTTAIATTTAPPTTNTTIPATTTSTTSAVDGAIPQFSARWAPDAYGYESYEFRSEMRWVRDGEILSDAAIEADVVYGDEKATHYRAYEGGSLVWELIDIGDESWSRQPTGWQPLSQEDFWEWPLYSPYPGYFVAATGVEYLLESADRGEITLETSPAMVVGIAGTQYVYEEVVDTSDTGRSQATISDEGMMLETTSLSIQTDGGRRLEVTYSWQLLNLDSSPAIEPPEIGTDPWLVE